MLRLFTIIHVFWRFRLDIIFLSIYNPSTASNWQKLASWRCHQPAPVRLRLALEYLGPIFVKFGQALSIRQDIFPADYTHELAKLQDSVPPESEDTIAKTLADAYEAPLQEIFSDFDCVAIGSASVAQVHRAHLAADGQEVAVKILRPNIEQKIKKDLKVMKLCAGILQACLKDGNRLKPVAFVSEFAKHLQAETNLLREATNCVQIGRNFANYENLRVPTIFWKWCTPTTIVMDYLAGVPISKINETNYTVDSHQLAKVGVDIFFTQVFRDNFFHADIHPGNIHVDQNGCLLLFDYGIIGHLSDFDREYLMRNFIAFFNRDYHSVAKMHVQSGWVDDTIDVQAFEMEIKAVCEPVFAKALKDISFGNLFIQIFKTARQFKLEAQPQIVLLQKALLGMESMARQLDPNINIWEIAKPAIAKWRSNPYRLKTLVRTLKKQTPDWLLLLEEAPNALRELIKQSKKPPPQKTNHTLTRVISFIAFIFSVSSLLLVLSVLDFY